MAAIGVRTAGPQVVRQTLANGLRVIVVRDPLAPVVTSEINYLVGSNEAPAGFPGLAHAQEHMMFRGSPSLSAAQLSTISAAMGGDFDANTTQTVTRYFFTVPAADLDIALHIEAERMRGVLDTQALWDKERGAIEQEVARDLSDPDYVFYTRLLASMFAGTPYAHDALGTRDVVRQDDGRHAPGVPRGLVRAEQRRAGDRRRRGPRQDDGRGGGPVRFDSLEDASGAAGRGRAADDVPDDRARHRPPLWPRRGRGAVSGFGQRRLSPPPTSSPTCSRSQRADLYALVPAGRACRPSSRSARSAKPGSRTPSRRSPRVATAGELVATLERILGSYATDGVPAELVEAAKRREIARRRVQT